MTTHDGLLQTALGQVRQSIDSESPGEGLTVVMDFRHHAGPAVAEACGLSPEEIDAYITLASKRKAVPCFVGWFDSDGVASLFGPQGAGAARTLEGLMAKARREGSHVVATFLASDERVSLVLMK